MKAGEPPATSAARLARARSMSATLASAPFAAVVIAPQTPKGAS